MDVQFAKRADSLSYLHSTLLGHWFGEVSPLLYNKKSDTQVRYYPKSDYLRASLGERDEEEGVGISAQVKSMHSPQYSEWFATCMSNTGNSRLIPFPSIPKGAAAHFLSAL